MICKGCGAEISENQMFCPHCGTKSEPAGNKRITKRCVNCGKEFSAENEFCDVCGGNLVFIQTGNNPNMPLPNQVPPYQTSGQVQQGYPNMSGPNQSAPGQMPPYQAPMGQMPPNMIPPYPAPYMPVQKKKSPVGLIIGLAAVALIFIVVVAVIIIRIRTKVNTELADLNNSLTNGITEDVTEPQINSDDLTIDDIIATPTPVPDDFEYNMTFSYSELPDVVSIDSDYRFSYYDYSPSTDYTMYTFQFNDTQATDDEFYSIVDDYSSLLMSWNSYVYEEDFTADMYYDTGEITDYFSKDGSYIGVTASVEDTGRYVYITIFDDGSQDAEVDTTSDYPNYDFYISGRDYTAFDQYAEVYMDNGIGFYLNDILCTDLGDGTSRVDCSMDLAATIDGLKLYSDDFLILPYDADGNMISDAVKIDTITDSNGYDSTYSFDLDTEYFYSYTLSFIVPSNTDSFTFYGANTQVDDTAESGIIASGTIYYIDIQLQ